MATYTENYSLVKPGYGDQADIDVLNRLMTDKVDALLFENRRISADEYDQEETYAVGDYAIYENVLYKCLADTTGNFDPTKWEMTNLAKEVSTKGEGGADVTKTASGNPIEISDGASAPLVKCVTQITGSQDLHGYDKPWVGGAGKNKLVTDISWMKSNNTGGTWSGNTYSHRNVDITILTDVANNIIGIKAVGTANALHVFNIGLVQGTGENYVLNGCPANGSNRTYQLQIYNVTDAKYFADGDYGNGFTFLAESGKTYRVDLVMRQNTGAPSNNFLPMIRLSTETDPTFAPYSNICPISGYSSVGVNESNGGVDVYDSEGTEGNNSNSLIEIISKDSFRVYNTRNQTYASSKQNISNYNLVVGKTYTIEADVTISSGTGMLSIRNSSNSILVSTDNITQSGRYKLTFVATLEMSKLSFFCTYDTSTTGDVTYSNIRLYEGSELKEYTISLGDTYYSGQIDVVKWVLVADKVGVDLGSLTYTYNSNSKWFTVALSDAKLPPTNDYVSDLLSSAYMKSSRNYMQNYQSEDGLMALNTSGNFIVRNLAYTDATAFKTAMSGIQLVYELVTPLEIPLTPTVISSLLGNNTMWTDGDSLEVEYITEEFQPIVDLIESNKHVYSTAEQIVGTWIDGSTLYEKSYHVPTLTNTYITIDSTISASTIKIRSVSMGSIVIGGAYNNAQYVGGHLSYSSFIRVILNVGLSVGMEDPPAEPITDFDFTIRYTKTTPTRSLNLTKSAVTEEIPDEIKNAPFEEKPDVNEADDSAPTEVDER